MSPAQMAARIAEVDQITRASVEHVANLRRSDRAFAIDESRCTDSRCSSSRCSCQRRGAR